MDWNQGIQPQEYSYLDQSNEPKQFYEFSYGGHDNYSTNVQYTTPQGYAASQVYDLPYQSETPTTQAKAPLKVDWFDRLSNGWKLEIVSEVFSAASLLAIIILLSRLQGQALSTWTLPVSPNAVIAILSIASKASLIYALGEAISQLKWLHLVNKQDSLEDLQYYDNASRGPLGAARMFWAVRPASFLVYLSCLTILLALAFEPFSQQLLYFDERVITYPDLQSSVSLSTAYDFGSQGVDGVSAVLGGSRDNLMTAATVSGLYDLVRDPPFKCPGSTCNYPTITSFGVCSECVDITSTIEKTQINTTFGERWSFRTPSNVTLVAGASTDAHIGFVHTLVNATARSLNSDFAGLGMPVRSSLIRFPDDQPTGRSNSDNWMDALQAYECTVSFCDRQYVNLSTVNGTLTRGEEHIIKLNNSDVPSEGAP